MSMRIDNTFIHICGKKEADGTKWGSFFINANKIINFTPLFENEDGEYPIIIKLYCEGFSYPLLSDDIEFFENRLYDGEKGFKR